MSDSTLTLEKRSPLSNGIPKKQPKTKTKTRSKDFRCKTHSMDRWATESYSSSTTSHHSTGVQRKHRKKPIQSENLIRFQDIFVEKDISTAGIIGTKASSLGNLVDVPSQEFPRLVNEECTESIARQPKRHYDIRSPSPLKGDFLQDCLTEMGMISYPPLKFTPDKFTEDIGELTDGGAALKLRLSELLWQASRTEEHVNDQRYMGLYKICQSSACLVDNLLQFRETLFNNSDSTMLENTDANHEDSQQIEKVIAGRNIPNMVSDVIQGLNTVACLFPAPRDMTGDGRSTGNHVWHQDPLKFLNFCDLSFDDVNDIDTSQHIVDNDTDPFKEVNVDKDETRSDCPESNLVVTSPNEQNSHVSPVISQVCSLQRLSPTKQEMGTETSVSYHSVPFYNHEGFAEREQEMKADTSFTRMKRSDLPESESFQYHEGNIVEEKPGSVAGKYEESNNSVVSSSSGMTSKAPYHGIDRNRNIFSDLKHILTAGLKGTADAEHKEELSTHPTTSQKENFSSKKPSHNNNTKLQGTAGNSLLSLESTSGTNKKHQVKHKRNIAIQTNLISNCSHYIPTRGHPVQQSEKPNVALNTRVSNTSMNIHHNNTEVRSQKRNRTIESGSAEPNWLKKLKKDGLFQTVIFPSNSERKIGKENQNQGNQSYMNIIHNTNQWSCLDNSLEKPQMIDTQKDNTVPSPCQTDQLLQEEMQVAANVTVPLKEEKLSPLSSATTADTVAYEDHAQPRVIGQAFPFLDNTNGSGDAFNQNAQINKNIVNNHKRMNSTPKSNNQKYATRTDHRYEDTSHRTSKRKHGTKNRSVFKTTPKYKESNDGLPHGDHLWSSDSSISEPASPEVSLSTATVNSTDTCWSCSTDFSELEFSTRCKSKHRGRRKVLTWSPDDEIIGPFHKRGFQHTEQCFAILDNVYNLQEADFFRDEILAQELEDYYKVVKFPVCLDTIASRLRQRMYNDLNDFVKDMRRIFYNCQLYFKPGSETYQQGVIIENFFEQKLMEMLPDHDFSDVTGSPVITMTPRKRQKKKNKSPPLNIGKDGKMPGELRALFG